MPRHLKLQVLPGHYAVSRLPADAAFPEWADGPGFVSISRSEDELSVVCQQARVPAEVQQSGDWACIRLIGPFPFEEAGIIAAVINPLASAGLGVFVVSTYDGDHLLLKQDDLDTANRLLRRQGHLLIDPAADDATASCG